VIFHAIEHWIHVPWVVQATLVAGILLVYAGVLVRRRVATPDGGVIPDEGVTLRNLLEVLVEWLAGLARDRMGPDWRKYFPIVGTMFFFILVSNLLGLVPGLDGATSDANTTWAWAVISWVFYTLIGIRKHGPGRYLVKFMGPSFRKLEIAGRVIHIRALAIIFMPLELLLDLARMLTLAVRLLANMFADHTVIAVWLSLVPIGVPAIFMGLGLVISFLQAFVFALLTMIYIGLALDEPH
jgi:F-type H+-transporting ATPase subunit a